MKKLSLSLLFILLNLFFMPCVALDNIILVNHLASPLRIQITKNGHIIPDFEEKFILRHDELRKSRVIESADEEAYLRAAAGLVPHKSAFFGIDQRGFHGYIGKGIAYSWQDGQDVIVTFCTPLEYKTQGHC